MSLARTNPEVLSPEPARTDSPLAVPLDDMSKSEINDKVDFWLNDMLEVRPAGELYVYAKQMEEAAAAIITKLKESAFNDMATRFEGETGGKVLGHEVKLSYPEKWMFSQSVVELERQQKLELDALKASEKASGAAKKESQGGRITVTLRK